MICLDLFQGKLRPPPKKNVVFSLQGARLASVRNWFAQSARLADLAKLVGSRVHFICESN